MIDADIAKATSNYGSLKRDLDEENPMVQSDRALIKPPKQERVIFIFVATFIAALGPTSFGYCLGYSSSALQDLQSKPHKDPLYLSPEQGSWFSVNILKFSSFFKKSSWAQNFARSLTKPQETRTLCVCCIMVSSEI